MINECLHVNNYFANTNLARQGETNYIAELTIPSCRVQRSCPSKYKPYSQEVELRPLYPLAFEFLNILP